MRPPFLSLPLCCGHVLLASRSKNQWALYFLPWGVLPSQRSKFPRGDTQPEKWKRLAGGLLLESECSASMQTLRFAVTWSFMPPAQTPLTTTLSPVSFYGFYSYPISHPQTNCLFSGSAFSVAHTLKESRKWFSALLKK